MKDLFIGKGVSLYAMERERKRRCYPIVTSIRCISNENKVSQRRSEMRVKNEKLEIRTIVLWLFQWLYFSTVISLVCWSGNFTWRIQTWDGKKTSLNYYGRSNQREKLYCELEMLKLYLISLLWPHLCQAALVWSGVSRFATAGGEWWIAFVWKTKSLNKPCLTIKM